MPKWVLLTSLLPCTCAGCMGGSAAERAHELTVTARGTTLRREGWEPLGA